MKKKHLISWLCSGSNHGKGRSITIKNKPPDGLALYAKEGNAIISRTVDPYFRTAIEDLNEKLLLILHPEAADRGCLQPLLDRRATERRVVPGRFTTTEKTT